MMGRETKYTFDNFATLFEYLDDNLSEAETLPPDNCNLSAQLKGLCNGGAAKVHTLPRTGCLATPNSQLCTQWCYEHSSVDPEWMCLHKAMASTPKQVSIVTAEIAELLLVLGGALEETKAVHR
jgi:hypothetical protein